jgi:hypothetical protein
MHNLSFVRTYRTEIALALLALIVHLACFVFVVGAQGSIIDAVRADDGYYELAQNVLAGNGFSWSVAEPYAPNPLRTPGYVYPLAGLIALMGVAGAALVQLLAASALPVLGMRITERMAGSRPIGLIAGAILAIDPTLALLSFQFYTETLFLLLFFVWTLVSLRYLEKPSLMTLVTSAVLIGCSILVKAGAQYIPFIFVALILWQHGANQWRRGVMHGGLYLLIVGAILAPWVVRNIYEFGHPGLSSQSAFVLYTNLAPAVLSVANSTDFKDVVQTFLTEDEFKGDAITLANSRAYTAQALEIAMAHPAATTYIAGKSLFTFFTNDGIYTLLVRGGYEPRDFSVLLVVARLAWVAITAAAGIGACVLLFKERSVRAIFIILMVAYFALTSTMAAFGTNPRYRLPVDPFILFLAALGGLYVLGHTRRIWNTFKRP